MPEIKRIPAAQFLLDSGLLFEINRQVLHQFGLALEVGIEPDGTYRLDNLWDFRHDPEGLLFEAESFEDGRAKYRRFLKECGTAKLAERKGRLGYTVQTTPEG